MTKTSQRASVIVLLSTVAGTASAQPAPGEPVQVPIPAEPAPLPQPPPTVQTQPMAPAGTYATEPPAPAQVQVYDVPSAPPPREREPNVGNFMVAFNWNFGIPVGSVTDFANRVSGVGFELLFRYWVHPRINVGLGTDWQTFSDTRERTTYPVGTGAVTATAFNSVRTGTIRLGGDYYFLNRGAVQPYAGLNVGFGWSTFETFAADIVLYDNRNSIVLGGGAGVAFMFSREAPKLLLGAKYSYQPSADFLAANDVQMIALQVGLASP
jgi:hypothetical protein